MTSPLRTLHCSWRACHSVSDFFLHFFIFFFSWRAWKISVTSKSGSGRSPGKAGLSKNGSLRIRVRRCFHTLILNELDHNFVRKTVVDVSFVHCCRYGSWYVVGSVPLFESWQIGVWGDDDVKSVRSRSPVSRKCSRASSARSASGRGVSGLNRCTVTSFLFCFLFPFFTCTSPHQLVQRRHPLKGWIWRLDVKSWMWRRRFHVNFRRVHFG